MSTIEHFDKLVQDARRDDGYINATKWCKHFGYDLRNWKRLPETKARLATLSEELKITQSNPGFDCVKITQSNPGVDKLEISESNPAPWIVERVGKTWVTWVHPVMAVHLASYLDPDFANYVAKIFLRYAAADPTLAADIASRQNTTQGLDVIKEAVEKRYKFLEGVDYVYTELDKVEISYYAKKYKLPSKDFKPITIYLDLFSPYNLLSDFLEEKHPDICQMMRRGGLGEDDLAFLHGYFKEEIELWVKEKNGTDCSYLR